MRILQMRYFQVTCKYNNISKAAEEFHVSQPTVTTAIKQLEEEFGVKLFARNNNKLRLTNEGKYFLTNINAILEQIDKFIVNVHEMTGENKKINIGIPSMVGTFMFPKLVNKYKLLEPNIKFSVYETGTMNIIKEVEEDQLDLGIITLPGAQRKANIEYIELLTTKYRLAVGPNHKFAKRKEIDIKELDGEQIILFSTMSYQNQLLSKIFEKKNVKPKIFLYSSNLMTVKECLLNGDVAAFLYQEIIDLNNKDLIGIPLKEEIKGKIGIIYNRNSLLLKDVKNFIEFCKKEYLK